MRSGLRQHGSILSPAWINDPSILFAPPKGKTVFESRFGYSARLGILSLAVAVLIGLPIGIISALKQNSWIDYVSLFIATMGISVPNFVIAIFLDHYSWFLAAPDPDRTADMGSSQRLDFTGHRAGFWYPGSYGPPDARFHAGSDAQWIMCAQRVPKAWRNGWSSCATCFAIALIPVVTFLGPALAGLGDRFVHYRANVRFPRHGARLCAGHRPARLLDDYGNDCVLMPFWSRWQT